MIILAFETSAKAASVAIAKDDVLLAEAYQNTGLTHSRTLMKMAEDLLSSCDLSASEVDAVACAAGPGSFTGIRIGVAAAKGFAWGRELPCYGVSTLEAMAHQAGAFEGIVCCAMDARRAQVYNALFECKGGKLARLCEDRAVSLEELDADLSRYDRPVLLLGDGAQLCSRELRYGTCLLMPEHLCQQRASGVALAAYDAAQAGKNCSGAEMVPEYLRLSQAERERLAKEQATQNEGNQA